MQQIKNDQLWKLAYESFNRSHEALENPGIVGNTTASHVVAKRLLDNISKLTHRPIDAETLHAVEADITLGVTLGWVTPEAASAMLELLQDEDDL